MWDWAIPGLLAANIWVMYLCAQAIINKIDELNITLREVEHACATREDN